MNPLIIPTAEEIQEAIYKMQKDIGPDYATVEVEVRRHQRAVGEHCPYYPFEVVVKCYHAATSYTDGFPTLQGALQQALERGGKPALLRRAEEFRSKAAELEKLAGGAK